MKLRIAHVLIITLFMFQNAWAMEQTFLVFCESQEISHDINQHTDDEGISADHDHGVCNDCCHLYASVIGITETPSLSNIHSNQQYTNFVKNKHHSIDNKPVIPPPIS